MIKRGEIMLAKEKLDQLKAKHDSSNDAQKVIDAFNLDLINSVQINNDEIPGYALTNIIYEKENIKVYQSKRSDDPAYYYRKKYGYTSSGDLIKAYKFTLVDDFDEYYDEIKSYIDLNEKHKVETKAYADVQAKTNTYKYSTREIKPKSTTYTYIMFVAIATLILGFIGALSIDSIFGAAIIIGSLIALLMQTAVLFGLAKIIDLLNK